MLRRELETQSIHSSSSDHEAAANIEEEIEEASKKGMTKSKKVIVKRQEVIELLPPDWIVIANEDLKERHLFLNEIMMKLAQEIELKPGKSMKIMKRLRSIADDVWIGNATMALVSMLEVLMKSSEVAMNENFQELIHMLGELIEGPHLMEKVSVELTIKLRNALESKELNSRQEEVCSDLIAQMEVMMKRNRPRTEKIISVPLSSSPLLSDEDNTVQGVFTSQTEALHVMLKHSIVPLSEEGERLFHVLEGLKKNRSGRTGVPQDLVEFDKILEAATETLPSYQALLAASLRALMKEQANCLGRLATAVDKSEASENTGEKSELLRLQRMKALIASVKSSADLTPKERIAALARLKDEMKKFKSTARVDENEVSNLKEDLHTQEMAREPRVIDEIIY